MTLKSLIPFLLLFAIAGNAGSAELRWKPGRFGRITQQENGRILTVTVPQEAEDGQNCAEAAIDLVPYRGTTVGFRIPIRAEQVSKPLHNYNGVKFMLNFLDSTGKNQWYNIKHCYGSFDWQELSFAVPVPPDAGTGRVMLGLQESSGTVQFNLSRLEIKTIFRPSQSNYRITYPEKIRNTPPLRGVMSPTRNFTLDDWETLRKWNVNLVRAQLCRNWGQTDTDLDLKEYDAWLDDRLDHFEKMFKPGFEEYGLRFVIDLHSPPGGRNSSRDLRMFHEKKYADHFIRIWKKIARRFKGNPAIWAYDLVNEPCQSTDAPYDYLSLQKRAAEAIRVIDPDTPIIVESNNWANPGAFSYLEPLEMDNIIYQCHMYIPGSYTHQNLTNTWGEKGAKQVLVYPGWSDGKFYDKEMVRRELDPVREFQKRHNARIYVGEFSAIAWAPGAEKLLADYIDIFDEYGWDWSYHAFREWEGWSVEHEGEDSSSLRPAADTPRKQVLLRGFEKNLRPSPPAEKR